MTRIRRASTGGPFGVHSRAALGGGWTGTLLAAAGVAGLVLPHTPRSSPGMRVADAIDAESRVIC